MSFEIYGTRSIIPNNYYFTFDAVYDESDLSTRSDDVFIGRTALALKSKTVWLKTVTGYIKVAKLDNEERFSLSEGYHLTELDDIDDITGGGLTLDGNGLYFIDFNTVSKPVKFEDTKGFVTTGTERFSGEEIKKDIAGEIKYGHWPTIRGMSDKNYLSNSQFLLRQVSGNVEDIQYEGVKGSVLLSDAGQKYSTTKNWFDEDGKQTVKSIKDIANEDILYYIKEAKTVLYQELIDITSRDKYDKNTDRDKLTHNNKTFYRTITVTYSVSNEDKRDPEKNYYVYDINQKGFVLDTTNDTPKASYQLFTRNINTDDNKWSDWFDVSEQYTGYIDDLNPPQQRGLAKAKGDPNNNLKESDNLVDAINTHDEIIGARDRINKNNGQVNSITNGQLSESLQDDNRIYDINPDNIMDALVEIAADIGKLHEIEDFSKTYNLSFKKDEGKEYTNGESWNTDVSEVWSLTSIIKKLDNILGSQARLGKSSFVDTRGKGKQKSYVPISGNGENDKREYTIKETNVIDALVRLAANIGSMSNINDDNLSFVDTQKISTDMADSTKAKVVSLADAIQHLSKHIIGNVSNGFEVKNNVDNDSTVVKNINDLNKALGAITSILEETGDQLGATAIEGSVGYNNNSLADKLNYLIKELIGYRSTTNPEQNGVTRNKTVIGNINELNKTIGNKDNLDNTNEVDRTKDLITVLNHLNKNRIGELSNITVPNVSTGVSEELSGVNTTIVAKLNNILEKIIGYQNTLTENYNGLNKTNSVIQDLNEINKTIGNKSELDSVNFDNTENIIENLNDLSALLGNLKGLTETDLVDKNKSIIEAINYIVEELIGDMVDDNGEPDKQGSRGPLQEQIITANNNINELNVNLNMLDSTVQALGAAQAGAIYWQTL